MKKMFFVLLGATLLLGVLTATVGALSLQQAGGITFNKMSVAPSDPYPGQEIVITLDYVNGENVLAAGTGIPYELFLNSDLYSETDAKITFDQEIPAKGTGQTNITIYAPDVEGTYSLRLTLKPDDGEQAFGPEPIVVDTALPDGLSQIFAGLGIFVAVMVVMAMATEVIIETLKSMMGLKSKVTAMEAFGELKSELPGLLAGAGVDTNARRRISNLVDAAEKSLKPVQDLSQAVDKIKAGQFFEAYEAINNLKLGISTPDVEKLRETAKDKVVNGLEKLQEKLGMDSAITAQAKNAALKFINDATPSNVDKLLKDVFASFQTILQNPAKVEKWLLEQMDKYITQGEAGLNNFLEQGLKSVAGLGIDEAEARKWFTEAIDAVEATAREKSEVYAHATRNLLTAVEERRNKIQSPVRNVWRRLRDSHIRLWVFNIFILGLLVGCILGIIRWNPLNLTGIFFIWLEALITGLLVGTILFVISILFSGRNWNISLGDFLRHKIEHPYNNLIGRDESINAPENYGNVDKIIETEIGQINSTTLAGILLSRENQHQDEETKRVRTIRIISAIVGTFLAYYMKIDAAVYLGYAVPDVVQQINSVALHTILPFLPADLTTGMLLTGLAASAGSKFWRDLLARLQSARGQAEETARMVERVKGAFPNLQSGLK